MAVPLIWVAVMGARVAAPTIIRFIASKGAQQAAKKYGLSVVRQITKLSKVYKGKNSSMVNAIKQLKGGKGFKVKYKAKTPKGKAIAKKITQKAKGKPVKTAKGKPTKVVKGRPVKTAKPKPVKTAKPKPVKTAKGKPTKTAKGKPTKTVKGKPIKTAKGKPTKTAKGKPIKTAKGKPTKLKPTKTTKLKPTKVVKGGKTFWTKGKIIGGAITAGTIAGMFLSGKGKLGKGRIIIKGQEKKKPEKIIPRPKPDAPRDRPGPQSGPQVKTKLKDIPGSSQYGIIRTGPQVKKKFTEEREKSFEARVRALVAQKDKLKNVEAGDGRSEYQVRMHKLKKENKKAWKQLFTMGGKLK